MYVPPVPKDPYLRIGIAGRGPTNMDLHQKLSREIDQSLQCTE